MRAEARGEDPAGGTGEGAFLNELTDDVCKLLVSILCGARGGWRGTFGVCNPELFKVSLEEDCAAAPHDRGLALGGMRRLCIAGKGGKEHGRKGNEKFPKPCVV